MMKLILDYSNVDIDIGLFEFGYSNGATELLFDIRCWRNYSSGLLIPSACAHTREDE